MQAPDLVLTAHDKEGKQIQNPITISSKDFSKEGYTKTVLVFYQSGCGPCEELMGQLPQYYDKLKSNGIRVISFAADENEQQFNSTATSFPWKDKYCDFKGIKGVNFKNYAVVGTPTIYILDKNGKIEAKLASMSEIVAFVFKS
jgi:thiol-disulfide isomerase/thioredoxin